MKLPELSTNSAFAEVSLKVNVPGPPKPPAARAAPLIATAPSVAITPVRARRSFMGVLLVRNTWVAGAGKLGPRRSTDRHHLLRCAPSWHPFGAYNAPAHGWDTDCSRHVADGRAEGVSIAVSPESQTEPPDGQE